MTRPKYRSRPADRAVLRYLCDLLAGDGGYELGSVRGWAADPDIASGAGCTTRTVLPRLHEQGFVSREDVRVPGLVDASWGYRITELGANTAIAVSGDAPVVVQPRVTRPNAPGVHLPYEHLVVHLVLRACWGDRSIGERFGGTGWALPHELEERLVAFNNRFGPPLAPTDPIPSLEWLEARALVEWAQTAVPEGEAPGPVFWRPSPRGVHIIPLLWREPGDPGSEARWELYLPYFPFHAY